MGKIKSEIPKGHFVFRNAPNAKGERALNLQYVCNGCTRLQDSRHFP